VQELAVREEELGEEQGSSLVKAVATFRACAGWNGRFIPNYGERWRYAVASHAGVGGGASPASPTLAGQLQQVPPGMVAGLSLEVIDEPIPHPRCQVEGRTDELCLVGDDALLQGFGRQRCAGEDTHPYP
jgi:hypothetical protein